MVETNWTEEEFKSYLFIYCANADYEESSEEIKMAKAIISEKGYEKMHKEFDADNDYQSLQKIQSTVKRLEFDENKLDSLCADVKQMFLADGDFDIMEKNLFLGLKRILSKN